MCFTTNLHYSHLWEWIAKSWVGSCLTILQGKGLVADYGNITDKGIVLIAPDTTCKIVPAVGIHTPVNSIVAVGILNGFETVFSVIGSSKEIPFRSIAGEHVAVIIIAEQLRRVCGAQQLVYPVVVKDLHAFGKTGG